MLRRLIAATAAVTLWAPAALASTLPPLDFHANQVIVGLGLLDANLDYALTDRLSLGFSANPLSPVTGRATLRVGETAGLSYGLSLSAGYTPNIWGPVTTVTYSPWFQPAAVLSWRLGESPVSLRGTVGPLFSVSADGTLFSNQPLWFWPNLELAYRLNANQELTLGGNGLVGWRGSW